MFRHLFCDDDSEVTGRMIFFEKQTVVKIYYKTFHIGTFSASTGNLFKVPKFP